MARSEQSTIICIAILSLCTAAQGRIIYVDDDANSPSDGSSWQNAYKYLQDALADANDAAKPAEIHVAQGIYKPDCTGASPDGSRDRKATFQMLSGVVLRGGYAGYGTSDPNLRNVDLYQTTLSGDLDGDDRVVDDPTKLSSDVNRYKNSYHVVTGTVVNETAVLDGFVITGGFFVEGVPSAGSRQGGAGLYNSGASPTIIDCTFLSNGTPSSWGGGVLNAGRSIPVLIRCEFLGNHAGGGGGVCNTHDSSAAFKDCLFVGNQADHGAGMYNSRSSPQLTNCTFKTNHSEPFGGAIYNDDSEPVLTACTLVENEVDGNMSYVAKGGAIFCSGGIARFTECLFTFNRAECGGAIYCENATLLMTDCEFAGNYARRRGGPTIQTDGGAIHHSHARLFLSGCRFTGNTADFAGGALSISLGSGEAQNCTWAGNTAAQWGGGILNNGSQLLLNQCAMIGNRASRGSALDNYSGTSVTTNSIYKGYSPSLVGGSATITYSNVTGGWPGQGNMDTDPCFVEAGYWSDPNNVDVPVDPNRPDAIWIDGDYHLKSQAGRWDPNGLRWVMDDVSSPCIDAGDPNSPVGDEPVPNGARINMGAYGGTAEASMSPSPEEEKMNGVHGTPYRLSPKL